MLPDLITGMIAMGLLVAAVFFHRFWRETRDRLFALFAISLIFMAVNRIAMAIGAERDISRDYFDWMRLVSFAIILLAILDKNRRSLEHTP